MKLNPYLTPYMKINSEWIKDVNIRSETVKLLEKNMEEKLHDTDLGNDFSSTFLLSNIFFFFLLPEPTGSMLLEFFWKTVTLFTLSLPTPLPWDHVSILSVNSHIWMLIF